MRHALDNWRRTKTGRAAIGKLSKRTEALLTTYLKTQLGDAMLLPDAILFRNRSGTPTEKTRSGMILRPSVISHFRATRAG